MSYNGAQMAGTFLNSVGFTVSYPSPALQPIINQILMKGIPRDMRYLLPRVLLPHVRMIRLPIQRVFLLPLHRVPERNGNRVVMLLGAVSTAEESR